MPYLFFAYQFVRRDDGRVSGTSPLLNVLKALRCQNILAFCSGHCQNWPCLLSQRHLHVPYHHSNSDFPYPHLSVRAAASKMSNNADLLWLWMNEPVMGFSLSKSEMHFATQEVKRNKTIFNTDLQFLGCDVRN